MTGDRLDQELLVIAREAASRAAALLVDERPDVLFTNTKSSSVDIVTDMDRRSESLIRDIIAAARPTDEILGEEGGSSAGASGVTWLVDPIDGTVNYFYDLPNWAVSIAAEVNGLTRVGVVAVPLQALTFWAVRGQGANSDGRGGSRVLHASAATELSQSLIATGFGYRRGRRAMQARVLADVLPNVRDIRRGGAAAVDLCLVASGRVDGYFERGLAPWDVAAGALIASEAGAIVVPRDDSYVGDGLYLCVAPGIADQLGQLLSRAGAAGPDLPDDFDQ